MKDKIGTTTYGSRWESLFMAAMLTALLLACVAAVVIAVVPGKWVYAGYALMAPVAAGLAFLVLYLVYLVWAAALEDWREWD